jgi:hypothetical protein
MLMTDFEARVRQYIFSPVEPLSDGEAANFSQRLCDQLNLLSQLADHKSVAKMMFTYDSIVPNRAIGGYMTFDTTREMSNQTPYGLSNSLQSCQVLTACNPMERVVLQFLPLENFAQNAVLEMVVPVLTPLYFSYDMNNVELLIAPTTVGVINIRCTGTPLLPQYSYDSETKTYSPSTIPMTVRNIGFYQLLVCKVVEFLSTIYRMPFPENLAKMSKELDSITQNKVINQQSRVTIPTPMSKNLHSML